MNAVRRFLRYEPYDGGRLELILIRLFFVAILLYKGDFLFGLLHSNGLFDKYNYDATPVPNGLANFFSAEWFTWIYHYDNALWYGLWVAGAFFVAGVLTLPAIGYILVLTVGIGTLRNSQGHIHHGTQMMALTVLSIFIGYLYCAIRNLVSGEVRLPMLVATSLLTLALGYGTYVISSWEVSVGAKLEWLPGMVAVAVCALLVGIVLVGIVAVAVCALWGIRKVTEGKWPILSSLNDHRFGYLCALQGIGAYYFVAGVAKIEARGLIRWVSELRNMGIYVDRNGHQQFLAGGEQSSAEAYERSQMIAGWINDHPVLTILIFAPGLLVELAAPAALLNRWVAFWIGVTVMGLHLMVGYIMQLSFPMNELIILIFLINVPFMISWLLVRGGRAVGLPALSPEAGASDPAR